MIGYAFVRGHRHGADTSACYVTQLFDAQATYNRLWILHVHLWTLTEHTFHDWLWFCPWIQARCRDDLLPCLKAPIISPYKHIGHLSSCAFHSFSDVFPASPASEVDRDGRDGQRSPNVTDIRPRDLGSSMSVQDAAEGALVDCWAMEATMEYNSRAVTEHTHLACMYCATYDSHV